MISERSLYYRIATALSVPMVGYFIASVFHSQFWGNILSPVIALACAGLLLYTFLRLRDHKLSRISILFESVACMIWGIADILWVLLEARGIDPGESQMIWILYSFTNLFLLLSAGVFATIQFRKWSLAQLVVDGVTTVLSAGAFVWIAFFNRDWSVFGRLIQMDYTSISSIVIDVLLASGIFMWYLSVRSGNIPRYLLLMAAGVNLFALSDLLYYYLDLYGMYIPNSLMDFAYIFSLYCIALGALRKACMHKEEEDIIRIRNTGLENRWAYFVLFPLSLLVIRFSFWAEDGFNILDFAFFAGLIFLNWSFTRYVQLSIENERLLNIEKQSKETLEQKVAEQVKELVYLANQDTLTSLRNRRCFMVSMNESIRSVRPEETLALMMLDIDRFKAINDSLGHDAGDRVLIEFANRLVMWNRFGATIARLGGDEFGFIFTGNYAQEDLAGFCRDITEICNEPILIGGSKVEISASIGVAVLSQQASDAKMLMKNADIAMYQAKAQGYNKYQFFDPVFGEDAVNSSRIELLLRQVDVEKEFELYYQPQFSLPHKELVGAEALIRWNNKGNGYIPPNAFIPVAEKIEYIAKIGKWVLNESIRQAVAWNKDLERPIKIGINISPRQLNDDAFLDILRMLIQETGAVASWLDVEITENTW